MIRIKPSVGRRDKLAVGLRISVIDGGRVKRYFAGVEALAREARNARDPRVIAAALAMMAEQREVVSQLLGEAEITQAGK